MGTARALLLLAYTKQTLPLIGYSLKGLPGVQLLYKINRTTGAIGVILAFTGKKMFYFTLKSEGPPKNSKTSRGT
jgi:hypothetical protein